MAKRAISFIEEQNIDSAIYYCDRLHSNYLVDSVKKYDLLANYFYVKSQIYFFNDDFDSTLIYIRKTKDVYRKCKDSLCFDLFDLHSLYGNYYYYLDNLNKSKKHFLKAKRSIGPNLDLKRVLKNKNDIAKVYADLEIFSKSEQLFIENLNSIPYDDDEFLQIEYDSQLCLAVLYMDLSKYLEALKYLEAAENSLQKLKKDNKYDDYCRLELNKGILYTYIGDFGNAEKHFFNSEKYYFQNQTESYNYYLGKLNNCLGYLYDEMGNYEKSKFHWLKSLEIRLKVFGENSFEVASSFNNLGNLYLTLGQDSLAEFYLTRSSEIILEVFGKNHSDYAMTLMNLSNVHVIKNDFATALYYNELAYKIYRKNNKEYEDYLNCIISLAFLNNKLGFLKTSKLYLTECERKLTKIGYPQTHFLWGEFYYAKCIYHSKNNENLDLENELSQLLKISKEKYLFNLLSISNEDRIHSKKELNKVINLTFNPNLDTSLIINRYEVYLNMKGLNFYLDNILFENNLDFENKVLLDSINKLKKLYNERIEKSDFKQIDDLEANINELIKKLTSKLKIEDKIKAVINWNDITDNLSSNEIFIDIIRLNQVNREELLLKDSSWYIAFIFNNENTLVDYVFFLDGTKIEQDIYNQYKLEATNSQNKTDLKSAIFYNNFWKPIADKIGDTKTIYVSLGGVYNKINLNTIYNPTTSKYLFEEKDIRIVNSARDFISNKENEKKKFNSNTVSLFGFPNFDGNATLFTDTSDLFVSTKDLNSFWLDSLTRGGMKAKPLPATKTEVENISYTLKSKGWQVNSFLAENASETNIKNQQSPRILHLATHGYFFQDIPIENDNNLFLGMDIQQVVQDPMLRSGLLFTGANKTLNGETTSVENGLLSAAEASLLELSETELVVLSACETGKGQETNSEGVYGLRKAFSDAGAQNIIMSLWKVDDKVTQEFMSRFYEIWINEKTTIRQAFNRTQLEIKANYPEPYYWGAFILVGE